MTTSVVSVSTDTPVHEIVSTLLKHGISAVPVLDAGQHVVGIVSEGDLLLDSDAPTLEGPGEQAWWLATLVLGGSIDYDKLRARTAGEIMTSRVISVGEDAGLADIARLLERNSIKRVPVLNDNKLVGIVSRANLLHGLASSIAERHEPGIAHDRGIRVRVVDALRNQVLLNSQLINVTVTDGVVELWGAVDNDEQRKCAEQTADGVDGVSSVRSSLVCRYLSQFSTGFCNTIAVPLSGAVTGTCIATCDCTS
jgi:CBS domain-containing protein